MLSVNAHNEKHKFQICPILLIFKILDQELNFWGGGGGGFTHARYQCFVTSQCLTAVKAMHTASTNNVLQTVRSEVLKSA